MQKRLHFKLEIRVFATKRTTLEATDTLEECNTIDPVTNTVFPVLTEWTKAQEIDSRSLH